MTRLFQYLCCRCYFVEASGKQVTCSILQLNDLESDTPLQWSPCSTVLSMYLHGSARHPYRLLVLNLALDVVLPGQMLPRAAAMP